MPYTAAVALMYGTIEPRHFGEEYWRNPQLLALVQKVKVRVSEEANRRARSDAQYRRCRDDLGPALYRRSPLPSRPLQEPDERSGN